MMTLNFFSQFDFINVGHIIKSFQNIISIIVLTVRSFLFFGEETNNKRN